uniref:Alpha 1,4-glycosyltransferase domain-containing protein n=1 Tax=Odontella aurita TaxID=265563 RepID=A0A7S4NHU3_9STRA|mmetsp:Transcript_8821/g.26431  ORF Transcript_8821/g.26431 Transcript_8821/m.26431 type:complete len:944 (+) Transcript_8821:157-2988(+)
MWHRIGGEGRRGRRREDRIDDRSDEDAVFFAAKDGGAGEEGFAVVERIDGGERKGKRRRLPGSSCRSAARRTLSALASLGRLRECPRPPSSVSAARLRSRVLALPPMSRAALLFLAFLSFHFLRVLVLRPVFHLLVGPPGATQGGLLGIFVDYQLRLYLVRRTMRERATAMREAGVPPESLPEPPPVFGGRSTFPVLPHTALGEILRREVGARRALAESEVAADEYEEACHRERAARISKSQGAKLDDSENKSEEVSLRKILRPNLGPWVRPYRGELSGGDFDVLTFDEDEMRGLVRERCPDLWNAYSALGTARSAAEDRVELWALCAVWNYGFVYLGAGTVELRKEWVEVVEEVAGHALTVNSPRAKASRGERSSCPPPRGFVSFSRARSAESSPARIDILAATARHPCLLCAMKLADAISQERSASKGWVAIALDLSNRSECCFRTKANTISAGSIAQSALSDDAESALFLHVENRTDETRDEPNPTPLSVTVTIKERDGTPPSLRTPKISLFDRMQENRDWSGGGGPSWLCDRCLRSPFWGTFERCSGLCDAGYVDAVCPRSLGDSLPIDVRKEVLVDVLVRGETPAVQPTSAKGDQQRRIPRIVHQTYSEEISAGRYPHLKRLQNSWKNSGWEYRFYSDEEARAYVAEHYPRQFLDAFDALLPGAYKADLFRYLVLLKDGGIYADIDVFLNANLDEVVSPTTSFFVPRDRVAEYAANGTYCLWNGFLGASSGHPFLVRAVERTLNLILERADLFDMERETCRSLRATEGRGGGAGDAGVQGTMEDWKVRAEPGLLLSGPCALGVAVNEALGNDPLAAFDVGWLETASVLQTRHYDVGDALILVADKRDLGAQRFSDPERNVLIGSTDMAGLIKSPLELPLLSASPALEKGKVTENLRQKTKENPHYSAAAKGQWLWGSKGVYTDLKVNNEIIKLRVSTT